jgi:hypothetical protein
LSAERICDALCGALAVRGEHVVNLRDNVVGLGRGRAVVPRVKAKKRARKRVPNEAEIKDIIWGIVEELRAWRADRRTIERAVRQELDGLRFRSDEVKKIPTPTVTRAMANRLAPKVLALSTVIDRLSHGEADEFRKIATVCGFSLEALQATVAVLQSRRGLSGHVDRTKPHCAKIAYDLMVNYSHCRPSGTRDAKFQTIAALLFEAMTGEQNADLKRACDNEMHRRPRYAKSGLSG